MNISIKGLPELEKILGAMTPDTNNAVETKLKTIVLDLQGKSQLLAPVDTGDLRGSAHSEVNGTDGIVYFDEVYALRQHEEVEFQHPKGGQSKFLQVPYQENKDQYIDALKNAVKKAVKA